MKDELTLHNMRWAAARRYKDPRERLAQAERCRQIGQDPEVRRKRSENAKRQWQDPEMRRKQSENAKQQCQGKSREQNGRFKSCQPSRTK